MMQIRLSSIFAVSNVVVHKPPLRVSPIRPFWVLARLVKSAGCAPYHERALLSAGV